ncbi:MAG: AAA family ATPase [Pseudomonadota bacterium]
MYTDFFELKERPFRLTPDPAFLFLSETHVEALNHLIYGINNKEGFILITGEIGAGKTTLCRMLLQKLGDDVKTALIFNPVLSEEELLRTMLQDFGVESSASTKKELIDELNAFLLNELEERRKAVLIIDEAQNLTVPLLEQVRLLSNLETDKEKLVQIILFGQNELKQKLDLPALRQLKQRITVRYELKYLTREETEKYIAYRLTVAGSDGRIVFSRGALQRIYRQTRGVPRLINVLADRCLLTAYTRFKTSITGDLVNTAIRSLEGERGGLSPKVKWIAVALVSVLVVLSSIFLIFRLTGGIR